LGAQQKGSQQKNGVGYHLPSWPHQLMLQTAPLQVRMLVWIAHLAGAGAIIFFAATDGVATDAAVAAIDAANTHLATNFIMLPLPISVPRLGKIA
jgi:hypothetical protein